MPDWAVVISQPNAERTVFDSAASCGLDLWWPRIRRVVSKRGKRAVLIRSLFPRYLFAPMTDEWRKLCSMRGVHSLLLWGEQPLTVRDPVIQEIKGRCDEAGFYKLAAGERFATRQHVTVSRGPFAGMLGLYAGATAKQRETALFEMLGSVRSVEFAYGDLIAA